MAGSLTYREYVNDAGLSYSIKIDKSNASATVSGGTGSLCPVRTANSPGVPCGLQKRYVNTFNQANPLVRRRFYIGSLANITAAQAPGAVITAEGLSGGAAAGAGAGAGSGTWVITSYRGERSRNIPAFTAPDSGQTDGTITQ